MFLMGILKSTRKDKRYMADYCMCKKKDECKGKNRKLIHFGQPGGTTYTDGATDKEKDNYIARHSVREDFTDPLTPGALSRFILWEKRTIKEAIVSFKKRFSL